MVENRGDRERRRQDWGVLACKIPLDALVSVIDEISNTHVFPTFFPSITRSMATVLPLLGQFLF